MAMQVSQSKGSRGVASRRVSDGPPDIIVRASKTGDAAQVTRRTTPGPPPHMHPHDGGRGVAAGRTDDIAPVEPGWWLDGEGRLHLRQEDRWIPWFAQLAERLAHVYIINRDWQDVIGSRSMLGDFFGQTVGVFLDPPYRTESRANNLYAADSDSGDIADAVWELGESPRRQPVLPHRHVRDGRRLRPAARLVGLPLAVGCAGRRRPGAQAG